MQRARGVPRLVSASEAWLVRQIQQQDPHTADEAFRELERRHCPLLRHFLAMGAQEPTARDVLAQDLRLVMLRAIRRFDPSRNVALRTYVHHYFRGTVARFHNECGRHPVAMGETDERDDGTDADEELSCQDPYEAVVNRLAEAPAVRRFVASLSPRLQEVVRLRHWEGLSAAETARRLGVSRAAISKHEARIRRLGQQQLTHLAA